MAGSYGHVVDDDGRLFTPAQVAGMLENYRDVYETVEEMYGMIHWLAIRLAIVTGTARFDLLTEAERRYQEGVVIGGRHPEGDPNS